MSLYRASKKADKKHPARASWAPAQRRAWLGKKYPVDSGVLGMLYEDAMAARAVRVTKCPDGKRPGEKPGDRTQWSSKAWDRMK